MFYYCRFGICSHEKMSTLQDGCAMPKKCNIKSYLRVLGGSMDKTGDFQKWASAVYKTRQSKTLTENPDTGIES